MTPEQLRAVLAEVGVAARVTRAADDSSVDVVVALPRWTEHDRIDERELQIAGDILFDRLMRPVNRLRDRVVSHMREHFDVQPLDIEQIREQARRLEVAISKLASIPVPFDVAHEITYARLALRDLITRVYEGHQRSDVRQPDEDAEPKAEPSVSETRTMMTPG